MWYEWLNIFALIWGHADIFRIQQILLCQMNQIMCSFAGLPVTIARAGLVPFLISFLIGFLVQVRTKKVFFLLLFIYFMLYLFTLTLFWSLSSISLQLFTLPFQNWHVFLKQLLLLVIIRWLLFFIHIFIFLFYWTAFWHLMELILTSQYLQF